ncbi:hypothetical protein OXT66_07940 [Lentilactobacillus senioris]|uniref:hypothetical protein n=1 Tax=Lentilactobacillus senioris TaxID=931534 RepID=UPI002282BB03|nr:hypothetical protein [Lentilactobacillus senioris]MCY9807463.1 hypothetical protein [Lentilactobacillus senioris]
MVVHERFESLLEQLQLLSPKTDDNPNYEAILKYVLEKVVRDVANYVHIPVNELPEELDSTIVSMVLTMINTHQLFVPVEEQVGNVSSLTEGDTSISFKTPAEAYLTLQSVNSITDDYVTQLNQFRKVKR